MIEHSKRVIFLAALFSVILGLLTFRLYLIQIVQTEDLSSRGVSTRTFKLADTYALRGVITDRNYRELSDGGWKLRTGVTYNSLPYYERFGEKPLAVHLIGHLDSSKKIGLVGVEDWFNDFLKAPDKSAIFAEKDVKGRLLQGKGAFVYPPVTSEKKNVVLTIDKDVQEIVEKASDGKYDSNIKLGNGAIVVMDVKNSDILALVSRPDFDPNKPLADKKNNLMNKALEFYYPGSVFKILVAAAAFEEGLISDSERFFCDGKYTVNSKVYISCWNKAGHGLQTFTEAFANSCNTAFITIGQRVYKSGLENYVKKFRLDQQSIIGYPYNGHGEIDIEGGKAALANASIGQKGIKLTPVQVAALVATIARDGIYVQPRIIKELRILNGPIIQTFPQGQAEQAVSPRTAKKIQALMHQVTLKGGTGEEAALPQGSAGKTGSAQTGMKDVNKKDIVHAWFAGFAPLQQPQYAIIIFSEEGKYGGKTAAPLFKVIAENLLQKVE